jgi:uncharacterized protein YhhL (DUF1145 family)
MYLSPRSMLTFIHKNIIMVKNIRKRVERAKQTRQPFSIHFYGIANLISLSKKFENLKKKN